MATVSVRGLKFHVEEQGTGEPVVLLHGFTGSSRSWCTALEKLGSRRRAIAIDLLGHGRSAAPDDADAYAFSLAIDDLAEIARALDLGKASWLGYSMGGRIALGLALTHPQLVSRLVLESASPGISDVGERARRRIADDALAAQIAQAGVESFVNQWEQHPLWESQASQSPEILQRQREIRLANRATGLAGSLRGMGTGAQPSFWSRLGAVTAPTLFIAGCLDHKFTEIANRMAALVPDGTVTVVADAGHAVHLEQPARFTACVNEFLSQVDQVD